MLLFHLKSSFCSYVIKIFWPDFYGYLGKRLDKTAKVNFKIYDVTNWNKNIYNKHSDNQTIKFGQFTEYGERHIFLQNHAENKAV